MDTIFRLREGLIRALNHPSDDAQHGDQELFEELMLHKARLLKLLDVGQRSPQEQREVESGKISINGNQLAVNSEFAQQVIFLAQQLDCSEKYIASVLHIVMRKHTNLSSVQYIEATVTEFHARRRHLVEAVEFLLAAALQGQQPRATPTTQRLAKFVKGELLPAVQAAGGEITFAFKIFKGIEQLDASIAKAETGVKNATSNTVPPSNQHQGVLGADILTGRYQSLTYERRRLAISLSLIAQYGFLSPNEIKTFIDWLSNNPSHPMVFYILSAVLTSFDPNDPGTRLGSIRQLLATDQSLSTYMSNKFSPSTPSKESGLMAAILLKWTMFLTEARHNDASLELRPGFKNEELESQVWNAVQGDAFMYLALSVVHMSKTKSGSSLTSSLIVVPTSETQDSREVPVEEQRQHLLSVFETLVRSLIAHASSELRKIKQRQEDLVLANAQTDRARASSRFAAAQAQEVEKQALSPRHDIATLYSFMGLLFSSLPEERALQFWGAGGSQEINQMTYMEYVESTSGRLPAFLQWAIWSTAPHDLTMLTSLYEMLSGLAKGQQCSELAYNFMARGTGEVLPGSAISSSSSSGPSVSWSMIFGILDSWAASSANPRPHSHPQPFGLYTFSNSIQNIGSPPPPPQQITIGPQDVMFAQSFLRLLSTVVKFSVPVRTTIAGHTHFRAIPTLLSLIPLGIPLELKGALFDTLSAFCEPGAGSPGVEICKAVWMLMERLEVINVRGSGVSFSSGLAPGKGVEVELEQIEAVHRLYPSTISFLKLLSTLIHTPKRLPEKDRASGTVPSSTIPETLGQPYRLPGVAPFTAFVVDNVFANIPNREYSFPSDRWRINDLALCYVERALAGFNLEVLVNPVEDGPIKGEALISLLVHPGFDIITKLLSTSQLQQSLLAYIVDGLDGFEKNLAEDEPYFKSTIIRVLRIILRVLEIQDIFLDVMLPLLSEFDSVAYIGHVHHRSYFTKLDQALSFTAQHAPAIAQYMEYRNHSELVLLSLRIVTWLSTSPYFTNLVTLVERNSNSERILAAFVQTLDIESMEDVSEAELNAELGTGAGAPDAKGETESLAQAIRLTSLDLLIQDTASNRAFPNLGHWLLLGSHQPQIQDPHALNSRKTSIHILLDLVNAGIPRLKNKSKELEHLRASPLFITLPALGERCYRIIYQLCHHSRTSEFTTRYLRTREDFFARQLSHVPSQAPEVNQSSPIQVSYDNGSRVITTVDALGCFLRLRSFIFDLVALELHILTSKGHFKGVIELLEIMFGTDVVYEEEHDFPTFREVGQSNMRIVDFFQSLLFEWADSLQASPVDMQYLGILNLQSCIRKDVSGCDVVDRSILLRMLAAAKNALVAQGSVITASQNDQLTAETLYILESCAIENHRRQVAFSVSSGFEAWRRLLDIALTKCFDRLPHDRRENMLFDLLHVLPAAIRSPTVAEPTSILLSEATLSLITKLREDRRYQLVLQSSGAEDSGSLPAERLYSILRDTVEGILDNNHSELVRGNLYGSLINFIHLVLASKSEESTEEDVNDALAASSSLRDSAFNGSQSLVLAQSHYLSHSTSSLEHGILSTIKPVLEQLVAIISRDAIDGTEVWKTVAFMLLDTIVQLSSLEKNHVVLSALNRHGVLSNFVRGLKDADGLLQAVLKPDPDDLSSLYVYESKMSLFIRMAQSRLGAERLLEAQLIPTLAQCDYIDTMPESNQAFMDNDSFLPSAIVRYHQLFMPAIQVIDGILAVLGSKHATATNQALDFLTNHCSTIAILLKAEGDYVTLALLEEIHLLVTLCAVLLPVVPKTDLLSLNSGFGVIHAAILSLSTRCLGRGKAFDRIVPQTDFEVQASNVYAFGFGSRSKFEVLVEKKERLLMKSVVTYIGAASEFTEPEITLTLSPITITPKRDDQASRFSATVPTVGDALAALDDVCNDFNKVLRQISDIGAELAHKDRLSISDVQEILRDYDSTILQELEVDQTRSLIFKELKRIKHSLLEVAKVNLDSIEMLLLLIWRHLQYYGESKRMNMPPSKGVSATNAMRLLATTDPNVFRNEVGVKLQPVLNKLGSLELTIASGRKEWQESQGYIQIMCRRLRDRAGLLDDHESMSLSKDEKY